MDIQLSLLSSVIKEGVAGFQVLQFAGINGDAFSGDGKKIYESIQEYINKNNVIPSIQYLESKLNVIFPETVEPLAFFIEEFKSMKLESFLLDSMSRISIDYASLRDPAKLVGLLEDLVISAKDKHSMINEDVETLDSVGEDAAALYERFARQDYGITTPWKTLNDISGGFWGQDLIFFAARNGLGKCVSESSIITDSCTGINRTIKQIVEDNEPLSVPTWSKENGLHSMLITNKVDTGYKKCLEFTLRTGKKIKVTPEHPFLTVEGWKKAEELAIGATVGTPSKLPFAKNAVELKKEEIDLLAIFLADGSCTTHLSEFSKFDSVILQIARKAGEKFNCILNENVDGRGHNRFVRDRLKSSSGENAINSLLCKYGLAGVLSKNKVIPDAIFQLPKEQLARFISVFWSCDGYVSDTGPEITLASKKIIEQLHHLLLRFGVQSTFSFHQANCGDKKFDSWRLRILSNYDQKFMDEIGLLGAKGVALKERCEHHKEFGTENIYGFFKVSKEWVSTLFNKSKRPAKTDGCKSVHYIGSMKAIGESLGWKSVLEFKHMFKYNKIDSCYVMPHYFKLFIKEMGLESEYGWIVNSDIFWDEIIDIKDAGICKIYDLTVEPTHCFIANDIIVHNTWLMLCMSKHITKVLKKRALLISPEMPRERLALRMAAIDEKLNYTKVLTGNLSTEEKTRLYKSLKENSFNKNLFMVASKNFDFRVKSLDTIIGKINPAVVLIDGLYLLKAEGKGNLADQAPMVVDEIKRVAIKRDIPFVNTTQFNKDADTTKEDTVAGKNIAQTDRVNWHATSSFGMFQDAAMKASKTITLKSLKTREGIGQDVRLWWDHTTMNFDEVEPDSAVTVAKDADEEQKVALSPRKKHKKELEEKDDPFLLDGDGGMLLDETSEEPF